MDIECELGIGPTSDKREIRRAYARRLKETHPEDDPEGFQHLRQAYQAALNYADYMAEEELEDIADEQHEITMPESLDSPSRPVMPTDEPTGDGADESRDEADRRTVADMVAGLGRLLDEGDDRGAAEALEIAVADPIMLNLNNRRFFEFRLLEEVGNREPLPPETSKAAVKTFRWDEHWTDLPYDYQYFADRLLSVPFAEERLAELRGLAKTRGRSNHEVRASRLLFGRYRPVRFFLSTSLETLEAMRRLLEELRAEYPAVLQNEIDPRVLAWWTKATNDSQELVKRRSNRITWIVIGVVFTTTLLRKLLSG